MVKNYFFHISFIYTTLYCFGKSYKSRSSETSTKCYENIGNLNQSNWDGGIVKEDTRKLKLYGLNCNSQNYSKWEVFWDTTTMKIWLKQRLSLSEKAYMSGVT